MPPRECMAFFNPSFTAEIKPIKLIAVNLVSENLVSENLVSENLVSENL